MNIPSENLHHHLKQSLFPGDELMFGHIFRQTIDIIFDRRCLCRMDLFASNTSYMRCILGKKRERFMYYYLRSFLRSSCVYAPMKIAHGAQYSISITDCIVNPNGSSYLETVLLNVVSMYFNDFMKSDLSRFRLRSAIIPPLVPYSVPKRSVK